MLRLHGVGDGLYCRTRHPDKLGLDQHAHEQLQCLLPPRRLLLPPRLLLLPRCLLPPRRLLLPRYLLPPRQLRQLSQWGLRHLNVRFGSISRMLLVFRRWCEMPRSQPCPGASRNATWNAAWHLPRECCTRRQLLVPHLLCSAAQVTVGQGPGTPEWGNAFPVQPVETNHSAPEQPLPFGYGANDNVAPWPNADFMHVPGNEVLGSLPRATQELMAVHRPVPSH